MAKFKETLKSLLSRYDSVITAALMIICAVVLFINYNNPDFVPLIIGFFLILTGIAKVICIAVVFKNDIFSYSNGAQALALFIAGLLVLIFKNGILNFLFYTCGVLLLVIGILKLLNGFLFKAHFKGSRIVIIVEGFVFVAAGFIFMFINAGSFNKFFTVFTGIILVIGAIATILESIDKISNDKINLSELLNKKKKQDSIEAEIIEEREE